MRETLRDGLIICCIGVAIVGGLAWLTMGAEIKAAANAGFEQRGWQPIFEGPEPEPRVSWEHTFTIEDANMATKSGAGGIWKSGATVVLTPPVGGGAQITVQGTKYKGTLDWVSGSQTQTWTVMLECPAPPPNDLQVTNVTLEAGTTYRFEFSEEIADVVVGETHATNPIGEKGATHAKECELSEAWVLSDDAQLSGSFGSLAHNIAWPDPPSEFNATTLQLALIITYAFTNSWTPEFAHIAFADLQMGQSCLNCDELSYGPDAKKFCVRGLGDTIETWISESASNTVSMDVTAHPPLSYSFAGLDVIDRNGHSYPDALVWNTGVREWDEEGDPICPVCKTVAEWQAYDHTQARGCYSWDDGLPDLQRNVTLYIDRDWARLKGLDGFDQEAYATKAFTHDARIVIDGWPVNKTDRDCSPYDDAILNIAHISSQGIYAFDQEHTDWEHDANCNSPDEYGEFTTTAENAELTFSLVNNREARLGGLVQIQEAPAGVPDAYIAYKHDTYYSTYPFPELTRESVYCWKGYRYLHQQIKPPTNEGHETGISLTIEYHDSEIHSDPHVSDSTRQTDYEYTLGPKRVTTIAKMLPQDGLATNVCFDLGELQPMLIVKRLILTVEAVGTWEIGEPTLSLDTGDTLAERDAVSPHCYMKEFEHYAYRRGGISAVVDGVAAGSIEWPDTSHENTLEHTGGHFDYVVGKTSGIDMTSAASLGTYAGWINKCSDAWNAAINDTAAYLATSDGTNTLKTLSAYDVRPVNHLCLDATQPQVAIRVGHFEAAPGIHYTFTAEKITGGRMHGLSNRRNGSNGHLWRRSMNAEPDDDWEEIQDGIGSDGHGYWQSDNLTIWDYQENEEGELFGTFWDFSTDKGAHTTGRMATREFYNIPLILSRCVGQCAAVDPAGTTWIGIDDEEVIRVYTLASPIRHIVRRTDAFTAARHSHPCILPMPDGSILLFATLEGSTQTDILRSRDYGKTWQPEEAEEGETLICDDLKCATATHTWGIILATGVADGIAYFEKGGKSGTNKNTFYNEDTSEEAEEITRIEIDLSDDIRPGLVILPCEGILVFLTYGGMTKIYKSTDFGETWAMVEDIA